MMPLEDSQLESSLTGVSASTAQSVRTQLKSSNFSGALLGIPSEDAGLLVNLAAQFSLARISGYQVGAVAIAKSGTVYLGANIEYPGLPLNNTLHAEQSAILNAWMHDESELIALHVSAPPCGHCRQFIRELSCAPDLKISIGSNDYSIDELLPHAFGPVPQHGRGLMDCPLTSLTSIRPNQSIVVQRTINAAQRSYTPCSRSSEGFLIECLDGRAYSGRAAECTAFNPSISSIVTALNQRNLSPSRKVTITKCTLAKLATATVNPLPMAKAILSSLSGAEIEVVLMELNG